MLRLHTGAHDTQQMATQLTRHTVEFRVYSPLRTFTLFASDPSERDAWIRLINSEMHEVAVKA